jgi:hypothetical protein
MFKTENIHKLFMLAGIVAMTATLYLAWMLLQRIEPQAVDLLRQEILAELDLQSFHQQMHALETEEQAAGAEYSPQQQDILQADMRVVQQEMRAATDKLKHLNLQRAELAGNVKLTLLTIFIVLSASLMLIIFGFIGWYFRIRVVEEP